MIPVRARGLPTVIRTYPNADGARTYGICPACDGDLTPTHTAPGPTLATVYIGPGPNPGEQVKAREGRWHIGAAVVVHAACAGVPAAEPTP